jgi:hypothetical protein
MPFGSDTARLAVELNLSGNFNKESGKAVAQIKGMTTQTKSLQSQVKGSILQGVGLGAGLVGFNLLAKGVSTVTDAIQSAVDEEASVAQLTRSIKENAEAWDGNIRAVEDVIRQRQALAFTDDEQRDSLRALVAVTKDVTTALSVQRTAMDLARPKDMSLADATTLLGKVYSGNLGILSRYGIQLRKGATATEALAEIQRRATGQAEEFADSTGGKAAVAAIKFSEAMESIGRIAVPAVGTLADVLGSVADVIDMLTGGGSSSLDALAADLKGVTAATEDAADAAEDAGSQWLGSGTALDSLVDGLHNVRDAAADTGLLPHLQMLKQWRDELGPLATTLGVTDDQLTKFIDDMERAGVPLEEVRSGMLRLVAVSGNQKMWAAMGEGMRQAAGGAGELGDSVGDAAGEVKQGVRQIVKNLSDLPVSMKETIRSGRSDVRKAMQDLRFAMEHPFAGDRYVNFLRNKQESAQRKLNEALAEGKVDAAVRAQAIVDAIQGELDQLDAQSYNIRVRIGLRQMFGGGIGGALRGNVGRNTGQNAGGGVLWPGDWGTMGEAGPERVRNVGGVTVIEPMKTSPRPEAVAVTVRPVITAFMVGRELGRAATTRRSGAGVL